MCPHEYKLRLIMTTLERHQPKLLNRELAVLILSIYKKKSGLTYSQLSKCIGMHKNQLATYVRSKRLPSYTNTIRIMDYLEIK